MSDYITGQHDEDARLVVHWRAYPETEEREIDQIIVCCLDADETSITLTPTGQHADLFRVLERYLLGQVTDASARLVSEARDRLRADAEEADVSIAAMKAAHLVREVCLDERDHRGNRTPQVAAIIDDYMRPEREAAQARIAALERELAARKADIEHQRSELIHMRRGGRS